MVKLEWSEVLKPNSEISYTHVIAETIFGRFLITWKGWKESPSYDVDESPFAKRLDVCETTLEDAKEECEKAFNDALKEICNPQGVNND